MTSEARGVATTLEAKLTLLALNKEAGFSAGPVTRHV
jgi:hypothetical protein